MRKTQWPVVLIALLLTLAVVLPVSAGDEGTAEVGVQIQNKTQSSIDINTFAYPQSGADAVAVKGTISVAAESAYNYWMPGEPLPAGSSALVVSSTGEAGGIARTDWDTNHGAAIYSTLMPDQSVLVPLVVSNYAGQTSQITVQNTNTTNDISDVTLTLYKRGSGTPQKVVTNQTIGKGTSKTWNIADESVWGQLPDSGVPPTPGFVGSMVVESGTDLVVQSFIDVDGTPAVTGFTGVASDSADKKVYCPLIRANYYGDTGISIVNNNASAATVEITFRADPASPNQGTFKQTVNIAANSSAVPFQGPGGDSRNPPVNLPGGTGQDGGSPALTDNGFYGSAELSSDQPIVAVVNDTEFGAGWATLGQGTYNCSPASAAAKKFYLPLTRSNHVAGQDLTTGIQVFNITDSAATATLTLSNDASSGAVGPAPSVNNATKSMTAKGAANWTGFDFTNLPPIPGQQGWYGAGVVTCTQDCIVFVSDEGYNAAVSLDRANYNGIAE